MNDISTSNIIIKIESLVSSNDYVEELSSLFDILIEKRTFTNIQKNIEFKKSTRPFIIDFYLDYLRLCITDKRIIEQEKSELNYLRKFFHIEEAEILKLNKKRVKEICLSYSNNIRINNEEESFFNDDLQEALGLSIDDFDSFAMISTVPILIANEYEEISFTDKIDDYKNISETAQFDNDSIRDSSSAIIEDDSKKRALFTTEVLFQKVSPSNFLIGLSLVTAFYCYTLFNNVILSIVCFFLCLYLIHFWVVAFAISFSFCFLISYMAYDFVGIFSENNSIKIAGSLLAFLVTFFKLYSSNIQEIEYAVRTNPSRYIPKSVRQEVYYRDNSKCVDCGSTINLEYDHIIPFSKGGSNTAKNIQLLCQSCNRKKLNKING